MTRNCFSLLRAVALASLFCWATVIRAQPGCAELPASDRFLDIETLRLWEADAPGAQGNSPADIPTLTLFRPQEAVANGTAVIVAPGGGYVMLASNHEGRQVADWFTARGITAFVLKYRVGRKYLFPVQLEEAKRAIRFVRARAKEFGIAPNRIGFMGFSAGGHLAASVATLFDDGNPSSADPIERVSSRPDFVILGYPWLNAMQPAQGQSLAPYCRLVGLSVEKCKELAKYTPALNVKPQTPPTFIYHTTDDTVVPVEASVEFYKALHAASVPAEMHLFARGPHGSGLGRGDAALGLWPTLLEAWLRERGLLEPDPAIAAERAKASAPPQPRKPGEPFSVNHAVRDLMADPRSKAVLIKHLGQEVVEGIPQGRYRFSLRQLSRFDPCTISSEKLAAIESELAQIPVER